MVFVFWLFNLHRDQYAIVGSAILFCFEVFIVSDICDQGFKKMAGAILLQASRDARRLDLLAAIWLLTGDAWFWANVLGVEDGNLGKLAGKCLEGLV